MPTQDPLNCFDHVVVLMMENRSLGVAQELVPISSLGVRV